MKRRDFISHVAVAAGATGILAANSFSFTEHAASKIPAWKGFNLLDFFMPDPAKRYKFTKEEHLKWMSDWGFDFVRLPMAYPYYLNFDRAKNITPDQVYMFDTKRTDEIDSLISLAHKNGMHVCLNLHRAPGFCVNAGFVEPYNLWRDTDAQKAFVAHWRFWAKKYSHVSKDKISFDLLNEPCMRADMNDQHSERSKVPNLLYKQVASDASKAIRDEKSDAIVIADGNNVGNEVIPELVDLDIVQSCRGYYPGIISHYKAPWAMKDPNNVPQIKWPGTIDGQEYNKETLRDYYKEWIDLAKSGVGVHCGECGCWNKTPHAIFLAWFKDVLDILHENKIGFALWEFDGDFGILNSGREDVAYEDWHGNKLDRKLLNLLKTHM